MDNIEQLPLRYGHVDGITSICTDQQRKLIITGGEEGQLRLWRDFEDDVPTTFDVAEQITALCVHEQSVLVATEAFFIEERSIADGSFVSKIARFPLAVTHMVSSTDGHLLAAAEDFSVKWINISDSSYSTFDGHEAPVLSVAIDTFNEYACTACGDGQLRIWQVANASCVKQFPILPKHNDFGLSIPWCRMTWHPKDSRVLAVPVGNEVQMYNRATWNASAILKIDLDSSANICAFNDQGDMLAASCLNGTIFIWNADSTTLMCKLPHPKGLNICALLWNPFNKSQLLFADVGSNVGGFSNLVFSKEQPIHDNFSDATESQRMPVVLDDENSLDFDISKIKDSFLPRSVEAVAQAPAITTDDIAKLMNTWLQSKKPKPFANGSTPFSEGEQYLAWNRFARIMRYAGPEVGNSIDVEFHDTLRHQSMHFENETTNFTMADASDSAVVFASRKSSKMNSQLFVSHFSSWDNAREWYVDLPTEEDVQALCVSGHWVAVASDKNVLRVYKHSGLLLGVMSIVGPVVTMTGRGDKLFLVYHDEAASTASYQLKYCTVNLRRSVVSEENTFDQRLIVSPEASLQWIGLTELGNPCSADSEGIVRICTNGNWIPVCNLTAQSKKIKNNLWPVDIVEKSGKVICVSCKGDKYPTLSPTPPMIQIDWKIQNCQSTYSTMECGEELFLLSLRSDLVARAQLENEVDELNIKEIIQSFALAIRAEKFTLAYDIASLCKSLSNVELLVRYAHQNRCTLLIRKLETLLDERRAEEQKNNFVPMQKPEVAAIASESYMLDKDEEFEELPVNNVMSITPIASGNSMTNITADCEISQSTIASPKSIFNPYKRTTSTAKPSRVEEAQSVFDNGSPKKKKVSSLSNGDVEWKLLQESKLTRHFKAISDSQSTESSMADASQDPFPGATQRLEAIKNINFKQWLEKNRNELILKYTGDNDDRLAFMRFALTIYRQLD